MTKKQLIVSIRALTEYKNVTLKKIESILGMPKNSLSGMLNGSRRFAKKWERPLISYVEAKMQGASEIVIPIGESKINSNTQIKIKKKAKEITPNDAVIAVDALSTYDTPPREKLKKEEFSKTPPAGLSKSAQLRWHREHNQTLQ